MTAPLLETMRRGACPSLSVPMQTGDGYLSRIALTGPVAPEAIISLCNAALRLGNGLIDISARGNLQARGLSAETARLFEAEVRTLDLPLRSGLAVDTGPLAGLDPQEVTDPRPLAEAIRMRADYLRLLDRLAPKTAVIVDGGGSLSLARLLADIRLKATQGGWLLSTGGTETPEKAQGLLPWDEAPDAALALLSAMAERGPRFRGRDFTASEVRELTGIKAAPHQGGVVLETSPFGRFALNNGKAALGCGPAFGQMRADDLAALMAAVIEAGCEAVRPAPGHALMLMAEETALPKLRDIVAGANLMQSGDDPRASIAACPGQPGCASAHFDTHALARAVAALPGWQGGALRLHISGCAKGCAHPEPAPVTLSGTPDGLQLIIDGKASDLSNTISSNLSMPDMLSRISALAISTPAPAGAKAANRQE